MQFSSFSDFINMGGYGFYVWLSYGAATLFLTLLIISSKTGHQKIIQQILQRKKREDTLRQARKVKQQQAAKEAADLKEVTR